MSEDNKEQQTVEDILDDLSYSWSSPEAEHFNSLLRDKKTSQAKKMLLEYCSEEEAKMVLNYFKKEMKKEFEVIPTTIEEIEKEYPPVEYATKKVPQVLCNVKGHMVTTNLYNNGYKEPDKFWSIYYQPEGFIKLDKTKVSQVWKLVEKE